jgi:hypothetical protein
MPTKTLTSVVCWRSFASNEHSVKRRMTFPGDHEIPTRYPVHFCDASLPESEWPREEPVAPPEPLTGRFKVKIRKGAPAARGEAKAHVGGRALYEGDTIEVDAKDAEYLKNVGVGEIIKRLGPKKEAKPVPSPAPGITTTGRTED